MGHQVQANTAPSPGCRNSEHDDNKMLFSWKWFSWGPWWSFFWESFCGCHPQSVWTHPRTSSRLDIVGQGLACKRYRFQPNLLNCEKDFWIESWISTNIQHPGGETWETWEHTELLKFKIKQVSAQTNLTSHRIPQRVHAAASMHPQAARAHSIPENRVMTCCGARSLSCTYCVPK